jgi:hypothetical protein
MIEQMRDFLVFRDKVAFQEERHEKDSNKDK